MPPAYKDLDMHSLGTDDGESSLVEADLSKTNNRNNNDDDDNNNQGGGSLESESMRFDDDDVEWEEVQFPEPRTSHVAFSQEPDQVFPVHTARRRMSDTALEMKSSNHSQGSGKRRASADKRRSHTPDDTTRKQRPVFPSNEPRNQRRPSVRKSLPPATNSGSGESSTSSRRGRSRGARQRRTDSHSSGGSRPRKPATTGEAGGDKKVHRTARSTSTVRSSNLHSSESTLKSGTTHSAKEHHQKRNARSMSSMRTSHLHDSGSTLRSAASASSKEKQQQQRKARSVSTSQRIRDNSSGTTTTSRVRSSKEHRNARSDSALGNSSLHDSGSTQKSAASSSKEHRRHARSVSAIRSNNLLDSSGHTGPSISSRATHRSARSASASRRNNHIMDSSGHTGPSTSTRTSRKTSNLLDSSGHTGPSNSTRTSRKNNPLDSSGHTGPSTSSRPHRSARSASASANRKVNLQGSGSSMNDSFSTLSTTSHKRQHDPPGHNAHKLDPLSIHTNHNSITIKSALKDKRRSKSAPSHAKKAEQQQGEPEPLIHDDSDDESTGDQSKQSRTSFLSRGSALHMFGAGNSKKNYALLEEEDSTRRVIKEAGYIEASEYLSTSTGSHSYADQRRSKSVARTKDTTASVNKDAKREPRSKSLSRKLEADKEDPSPPPAPAPLNDISERKKKRGSDSSKSSLKNKPKQRRSSKFPSNLARRGSGNEKESQESQHHDGTSQSLHDDGYHTDEETLFSGSVVQRQAVVDTIASPSTSRASKVLKSKRSSKTDASDKKDASSTATSTTATTAVSKKTHGSSSSLKDKERRRARSESASKSRKKVPSKTRRSESVAAPKTRPGLLSTNDDEGVGSTHTGSQLSLLDNISVSDIIDSHHILERMKNDSALKLTDRWESVPVLMPFPDKDKTPDSKAGTAETSEPKLQSKKEQTDKPRASNDTEGRSKQLDSSNHVDKAANRTGRKERNQPEDKAVKERRRGESKNRDRKEGSQKDSSSPRRPRKSSSVPRTSSSNRDSSRPRSASHSRSLSRNRTDSARRINSSSKRQSDLERTLHQNSISNRLDEGDSLVDAESFAGTEPKEAESSPQQRAEPVVQQKPKRRSLLALVEKLYGGEKSLRKVMNDEPLERGRSSREMNMRTSSLSPSRSDRSMGASPERTRDGLDAVHHGGDKRAEMKSQSENNNSTRLRDNRVEMGSQSERHDHARRRDSLRDSRRRLLDNAMDVPLSRQAEARSRRSSIEKKNLGSVSEAGKKDSSKSDKKKAGEMDSSERRKSDKSTGGDMDSSLSKSVTFDLQRLPNESESNHLDNSEGSFDKSDSENSGKEGTQANRLSKSVALNPKQRRRKRNNVASETLHKSLNSIGSSSDIDQVQMDRMHASEHSQFGFTPLPTVPEQAWQRRRRKSTSTDGS